MKQPVLSLHRRYEIWVLLEGTSARKSGAGITAGRLLPEYHSTVGEKIKTEGVMRQKEKISIMEYLILTHVMPFARPIWQRY